MQMEVQFRNAGKIINCAYTKTYTSYLHVTIVED